MATLFYDKENMMGAHQTKNGYTMMPFKPNSRSIPLPNGAELRELNRVYRIWLINDQLPKIIVEKPKQRRYGDKYQIVSRFMLTILSFNDLSPEDCLKFKVCPDDCYAKFKEEIEKGGFTIDETIMKELFAFKPFTSERAQEMLKLVLANGHHDYDFIYFGGFTYGVPGLEKFLSLEEEYGWWRILTMLIRQSFQHETMQEWSFFDTKRDYEWLMANNGTLVEGFSSLTNSRIATQGFKGLICTLGEDDHLCSNEDFSFHHNFFTLKDKLPAGRLSLYLNPPYVEAIGNASATQAIELVTRNKGNRCVFICQKWENAEYYRKLKGSNLCVRMETLEKDTCKVNSTPDKQILNPVAFVVFYLENK